MCQTGVPQGPVLVPLHFTLYTCVTERKRPGAWSGTLLYGVMGTRPARTKEPDFGRLVDAADSHKYLGLWIDNELNWTTCAALWTLSSPEEPVQSETVDVHSSCLSETFWRFPLCCVWV